MTFSFILMRDLEATSPLTVLQTVYKQMSTEPNRSIEIRISVTGSFGRAFVLSIVAWNATPHSLIIDLYAWMAVAVVHKICANIASHLTRTGVQHQHIWQNSFEHDSSSCYYSVASITGLGTRLDQPSCLIASPIRGDSGVARSVAVLSLYS